MINTKKRHILHHYQLYIRYKIRKRSKTNLAPLNLSHSLHATSLMSLVSLMSFKSLMSLTSPQTAGLPKAVVDTKGNKKPPYKRRSSVSQFFYLHRIYGVP